MRGSKWGRGSWPLPPPQKKTKKKHRALGFLSNTGPDPLVIYKAIKSAVKVRTSLSARQRNAISMPFRWRADDSPFSGFGSSLPPQQLKSWKKLLKLDTPPPPRQNFPELSLVRNWVLALRDRLIIPIARHLFLLCCRNKDNTHLDTDMPNRHYKGYVWQYADQNRYNWS